MRIDHAREFRAARTQRRGPAERLRAAVLDLTEGQAQVLSHSQQAWASITFSGARHAMDLLFEGEESVAVAERVLDLLPEYEFAIAGHLVADASVRSVDHSLLPEPRMVVRAEFLLLEDG